MSSVSTKLQWLVHGHGNFTHKGYAKHAKHFTEELNSFDLHGRAFVVTGAGSGVGLALTKQLLRCNARVHMVCRDRDRGETAKRSILHDCGEDSDVHLHIVDLTNVGNVRMFARALSDTDIVGLINTAIVANEEKKTRAAPDRGLVDQTFAINLLMPWVLSVELIPLLSKNAEAKGIKSRIINMVSGWVISAPCGVFDLEYRKQPYDGCEHLSELQRALLVVSKRLAQKCQEKEYPVHVFTASPGWVANQSMAKICPKMYGIAKSGGFRSNEEGCDTLAWLCGSTACLTEEGNGELWFDREVATSFGSPDVSSTSHEADFVVAYLERCAKRWCADSKASTPSVFVLSPRRTCTRADSSCHGWRMRQ